MFSVSEGCRAVVIDEGGHESLFELRLGTASLRSLRELRLGTASQGTTELRGRNIRRERRLVESVLLHRQGMRLGEGDLLEPEHALSMQFFYVYLLQSESSPDHYYTGFTENLAHRLDEHNDGKLPNTARFRPWHIKSAHAFRDKDCALAFEKYLKSGSGRAFAKKRL
jgi:predicted GIY-YIG superfamily endonuclease